MEKDEIETQRANDRGDLIKRLFAVAISVGAATTIYEMEWVQKGRAPLLPEWQQLSILVVAIAATVLSWDGYLSSIKRRPLFEFWRFAIDIFLVFTYLFLLMTSRHLTWWLPIHALTYILYALWDHLSVRYHLPSYYKNSRVKQSVGGVYWGGLTNAQGVSRGPIITISWALYFCALTAICAPHLREQIFITSVFAILGLWFYRRDKSGEMTMLKRILMICGFLGLATIYVKAAGHVWPTDQQFWNYYLEPYIGPTSPLP